MRKSSIDNTFLDFYGNMGIDIDFLMKIAAARQVVKSTDEKRRVFEAFVFSICTNWDTLVETLLINCFNKDTSRYRNHTGYNIPKHLPRETCQAIVLGISYFDFKNMAELRKISKYWLVPQYNTFKTIHKDNTRMIDDFYKIRNYLAHYSDVSRRSLEKVYIHYGYKTFRRPGEFLLTQDNKEKIPRMGVFINNFQDTADLMAKFLNIPIQKRL